MALSLPSFSTEPAHLCNEISKVVERLIELGNRSHCGTINIRSPAPSIYAAIHRPPMRRRLALSLAVFQNGSMINYRQTQRGKEREGESEEAGVEFRFPPKQLNRHKIITPFKSRFASPSYLVIGRGCVNAAPRRRINMGITQPFSTELCSAWQFSYAIRERKGRNITENSSGKDAEAWISLVCGGHKKPISSFHRRGREPSFTL